MRGLLAARCFAGVASRHYLLLRLRTSEAVVYGSPTQRDKDRPAKLWIDPAGLDHVAISAPAVYQRSRALLDCESIFAADQKVKLATFGALGSMFEEGGSILVHAFA